MKLVIQYCQENDLLEQEVDTACELNLPFTIEYIPLKYPEPIDLIYRIEIAKKRQKRPVTMHMVDGGLSAKYEQFRNEYTSE